MDLMTFLSRTALGSAWFFMLPVIGIVVSILGVIAIRQSRRTSAYRRGWVLLWLLATLWIIAATRMCVSIRFSGEFSILAIFFLPICIGFLMPSVFVLPAIVWNYPIAPARSDQFCPVAVSFAGTSVVLLIACHVITPAARFQLRFPGLECGCLVSITAWWWIRRLYNGGGRYKVIWIVLTACAIYWAYLAAEFITEAVAKLLAGKYLISFSSASPSVWRIIIWLIGEPGLVASSIVILGTLLLYPPKGRSVAASRSWKLCASGTAVASCCLIVSGILANLPGAANGIEGEKIPEWQVQASRAGELWKQRQFDQSVEATRKALDLAEKTLGADDVEVARLSHDLATRLMAQGRYAESEQPCRRAYEIWKSRQGPDHFETARGADLLGRWRLAQGDIVAAEAVYREALQIREKTGEPFGLQTSLDNLAFFYAAVNNALRAEEFYRRSLETRERRLGVDHQQLIETLNAVALRSPPAEAEALLKRVLSIREETFGRKHPETARSLHTLGNFYGSLKRYNEGEECLITSLELRENILGRDHPLVKSTLGDLADFYRAQNRDDKVAEYEALHRAAISRSLNHTSAVICLYRLAMMHNDTGDDRGTEVDEFSSIRSVVSVEHNMPSGHPLIAKQLSTLAGFFCMRRRYVDAEPLLVRSLAMQEHSLGRENDKVLVSLLNLGSLYVVQKRYSEAEPLFQRVSNVFNHRIAAAPENPEHVIGVAVAAEHLAELYLHTGRSEEAFDLDRRAAELRTKLPKK